MSSTADVVHLDFLGLGFGAPQLFAQLAVAIGATVPYAADQLKNVRIACAGTHRRAQIETLGCEQASVELSLGGQTRPAAGTAKGLRHPRNETDFPTAIVKTPALRHFALVVLGNRPHRPSLLDARGESARRHYQLGPPFISIAHVHEFDESHDDGRA